MLDKYQTLQTIYDLVKEDTHPTLLSLNPGAIILRQNFGWDVIVGHLNELKADGLLKMQQFNTAIIHITTEGITQALRLRAHAA